MLAPVGDVDLAAVGALLSDPGRAKVLLALGDGRALPASMLAAEAGVAASTASYHLSRLRDAGLVRARNRGRYRYYQLAGPAVGDLIEAVARVAPAMPVTSLRQGTRGHAVRYARSCYDHLAGRLGVAVADALLARDLVDDGGSGRADPSRPEDVASFAVTAAGADWLGGLGISVRPRTAVRACLDWTEQRPHLAGPVGRGLLSRLLELGWLERRPGGRALRVTAPGRQSLPRLLGAPLPDSAGHP